MENFAHDFIRVGELEFHIASMNSSKEETDEIPFLLLHGFPECWYSYRYLMPILASPNGVNASKKSYKVYAMDLRGYNQSSKPPGVRNYHIKDLMKDVVGVIEQISPQKKVYLVGHDWGGALSWQVARYYPEYVKHLFILNCPPVEVLFKGLYKVPRQLLQSYYIFFFQIPFIPEFAFKRFKLIEKMYSHIQGEYGEFLKEDEVEYYVKAFEGRGAYRGINFYRAAMRDIIFGKISRKPPLVSMPTKVIWGVKDAALNLGLTKFFEDLVELGKYTISYLDEGTHNVQQNLPHECAREILNELNLHHH